MAADAAAVEHGLHFAQETEAVRFFVPPRGERLRSAAHRLGDALLQRRGAGGFVAADTGERFARHGDQPAAHQLQRRAVFVERLNGDGGAVRHAHHHGAVGVDRHGSQNALGVPAAFDGQCVVSADVAVAVAVGQQAQRFDRSARDAGEAGACIDVLNVKNGFVRIEINA